MYFIVVISEVRL